MMIVLVILVFLILCAVAPEFVGVMIGLGIAAAVVVAGVASLAFLVTVLFVMV